MMEAADLRNGGHAPSRRDEPPNLGLLKPRIQINEFCLLLALADPSCGFKVASRCEMLVSKRRVSLAPDLRPVRLCHRLNEPEMMPMMDEEVRPDLFPTLKIFCDSPIGGDLIVSSWC